MNTPHVIVSFTSWPPAMEFVPEAVRSILHGSVLPDRVVLYLTASQFPDRVLPPGVEALARSEARFEVRWCEGPNMRSYTKLVPALADFPDDVVVTIDDDKHYNRRMLERLLGWHRRRPEMIIAHNVRHIMADRDGVLKGYFQWKRYKPRTYWRNFPRPGYDNLLFGMGGVLYPPRSLDATMFDPEVFTKLAPTVDDVWFWAAATSAGTKVLPIPFGQHKPRALGKPAAIALGTINIHSGVDVNRDVMIEILKRYPTVKARLEESIGREIVI